MENLWVGIQSADGWGCECRVKIWTTSKIGHIPISKSQRERSVPRRLLYAKKILEIRESGKEKEVGVQDEKRGKRSEPLRF